MTFQHKENSGSIFKNDKREKETQPQMRGDALIGGVEYWVSAWTKEDKNGNRFQSLAFTPKNEQQSGGFEQAKLDDSDDIPF